MNSSWVALLCAIVRLVVALSIPFFVALIAMRYLGWI